MKTTMVIGATYEVVEPGLPCSGWHGVLVSASSNGNWSRLDFGDGLSLTGPFPDERLTLIGNRNHKTLDLETDEITEEEK